MASTHERRRAASRRRLRRQRWATAVGALGAIVIAVAIASSGHGSSHRRPASMTGHPGGAVGAVVPGGPLAPARFGGLGALWAPRNVVGSQPTTATAYQAASKLSGLPGYLLIADRGNNRIFVVDPQRKTVFRY